MTTEPQTISITTHSFEGRALRVHTHNGRPCVVAQEFGALLGYEQPRKLVDQIRGPWSDEFVEGADLELLTGEALAAWRRLSSGATESDCTDSVHAKSAYTDPVDSKTRSLVILYETGMHLAAIKARTPFGSKVRRWLATEVLPSIARTGSYAREPGPTAADVTRLVDERIAVALERIAGVVPTAAPRSPRLSAAGRPLASGLHEAIDEVTALATVRWYFAALRGAVREGRAHFRALDNVIPHPLAVFGWRVDAAGNFHTVGETVGHFDEAYGNLWVAADAERVFPRLPRPAIPGQAPELPRVDACLYKLGWLSADNITRPRGAPSYRVRGDFQGRPGSYAVVRWARVRHLLA